MNLIKYGFRNSTNLKRLNTYLKTMPISVLLTYSLVDKLGETEVHILHLLQGMFWKNTHKMILPLYLSTL